MTDRLDLKTPDGVSQNIERIAALFPHCVVETQGIASLQKQIDFDLLRQELSADIVEGPKERYRLEWPGKREAIVTANMPTTNTLRPVRKDSVNFDTTENLYIEGDNLEVLKLLQESYLGKVKMIYIDPPYNTGNDFVYKDNFAQDSDEYKADSGMTDELGNRLVANPETAGRYHSDWLTMMYPRLKLARNLLTDDGVIFISIDDNEVHNLRKMCDEVFGEVNFISQIIWKKKTGAGASIKNVFDEHEYVLLYAKNQISLNKWRIISDDDGNFKNPDNDSRGAWESCAITAPSANRNHNQLFMIEVHFNKELDNINEIDEDGRTAFNHFIYSNNTIIFRNVLPEDDLQFNDYQEKTKIARFIRRWAYASQNMKQTFDDKRVYLNLGNLPRYKKFEYEYDGKALRSIYYNDFSTQQGTDLLREIFGETLLDYPKPLNLVKHFINGISDKDAIILDFFSGSATTAHAVMQLNAEDGGNRKFIMVQLPEKTDEKSEAYKAGYKNICEIGKERIRRAGEKIRQNQNAAELKNEQNLFSADDAESTPAQVDTGFRVYRLDTSNMQDVYYRPQDYKQDMMTELFANHIKPDRTPDDLVAQVMLDWGLPLSLPIEQTTIAGKTVYKVAGNALYCCFDEGIDEAFVRALVEPQGLAALPLRIVFHDYAFANDTAKENVRQLLKQLSAETEMRVV